MDRGGAESARESGHSCRMWGLPRIAGRSSKTKGADRLFAHAAAASAVSAAGAKTPRTHPGRGGLNARSGPGPFVVALALHVHGVGPSTASGRGEHGAS